MPNQIRNNWQQHIVRIVTKKKKLNKIFQKEIKADLLN